MNRRAFAKLVGATLLAPVLPRREVFDVHAVPARYRGYGIKIIQRDGDFKRIQVTDGENLGMLYDSMCESDAELWQRIRPYLDRSIERKDRQWTMPSYTRLYL